MALDGLLSVATTGFGAVAFVRATKAGNEADAQSLELGSEGAEVEMVSKIRERIEALELDSAKWFMISCLFYMANLLGTVGLQSLNLADISVDYVPYVVPEAIILYASFKKWLDHKGGFRLPEWSANGFSTTAYSLGALGALYATDSLHSAQDFLVTSSISAFAIAMSVRSKVFQRALIIGGNIGLLLGSGLEICHSDFFQQPANDPKFPWAVSALAFIQFCFGCEQVRQLYQLVINRNSHSSSVVQPKLF